MNRMTLFVVALGASGCGSWVTLVDDGGGGGGVDSTSSVSGTATSTSSAGGGGGESGGEDCVDAFPVLDGNGAPLDIVFMIDNSSSMAEEITAIEQNINVNFAQIIGNSGVDYQVIMVTAHGDNPTEVCVEPPLSSATTCNGPPGEVAGQFHHYDVRLNSWEGICKLLDRADGPEDDQGLHGAGWLPWLRVDAPKAFVMVTDDALACGGGGAWLYDIHVEQNPEPNVAAFEPAALEWEDWLRSLSPVQFGTAENRNYKVYSLTGVPAQLGDETQPYGPGQPIAGGLPYAKCDSAARNGMIYQWLSKSTGGLRFPVCQTQSYDAVFQAIATSVISDVEVPCVYALSAEGEIDAASVEAMLVSEEASQPLPQLTSEEACGAETGGFFIEGNVLKLCPTTCEALRADETSRIDVSGDCL